MSTIEDRLRNLEIILPDAPASVARYIPAVQSGSLLIVSGQIPFKNGEVLARGPVPSVTSVLNATAAARQCAINGLAVAKASLDGDLERITRVLRLGVFVQSDDRFDGQPAVANGASDLMVDVFGARGTHARAAVGVNALPLNVSVEIEFMFEVRA